MKRHQWMRGPAIVLLSLAMLCNVALQASADEEAAVPISKNDALRIASSILKLSNKFELADAELIYGPIWNMRGMTYGKDYLSGSTEFNVDATNGDILFYRKYDSRAKRSTFTADYSREKAVASAIAFIAKAAPSLKGFALVEQPVSQSDSEIITPLFGDASYLFSFGVTYKGIPIKDASVTIQLDGLGDIQFYNYAGVVGAPSAANRVKTVDEIRRTFADNLQVELAYINRNNEWKLLYYSYGTSGTFDAVTGKDVNSALAYLEYPDELTPVRTYGQSYSPIVVDTEEKAKAIASGRLLP